METLEWLSKWLALIVAILAAIAGIIRYWRIIRRKLLRPAWAEVLKPAIKTLASPLSLLVPVALIVYACMYWASAFYADAPGFLLTDAYAFASFILCEAALVSAYGLAWGRWLRPYILRRLGSYAAAASPPDTNPALKDGDAT